MRLVTYLEGENETRLGCLDDGQVFGLSDVVGSQTTMQDFIAKGADAFGGLQVLRDAATKQPVGPVADVRLAAPILRPGKVICIGLNYADHAAETGAEIPTEPVVFNKFPNTVIGPGEPIVLPAISQAVDYEAELVVVVGNATRDMGEAEAMSAVFGYTCGHDVSARDWQKGRPGGQWLLGKSFDTFAPLGPAIVTADEIQDPHRLRVRFRLNGETLQDSTTEQLIFSIPKLISHLSKFTTLEPGDLIYTGTPPGVGMARDPKLFLQPGDVAEVEIESLGVLVNPVVAAADD